MWRGNWGVNVRIYNNMEEELMILYCIYMLNGFSLLDFSCDNLLIIFSCYDFVLLSGFVKILSLWIWTLIWSICIIIINYVLSLSLSLSLSLLMDVKHYIKIDNWPKTFYIQLVYSTNGCSPGLFQTNKIHYFLNLL